MNKVNKNTKAYRNKLEYIKNYNKTTEKLYIQFNPRTESDIIDWLKDKKRATYIKQLIREDMKKDGK